MNNNKVSNKDSGRPVVAYCSTTIRTGEVEIINNYRCNQQRFAVADMWRLSKDVKAKNRRTY